MSNGSNNRTEASNKENTEQNNDDSHDIFYMDSVERIKLIGAISDCDTQTLLSAYIDILGIESLRPFLLTTFIKSIPITTSSNRNKNKKSINPPPLPQKLLDLNKPDDVSKLLNHIDDTKDNDIDAIKSIVNNTKKNCSKKHKKHCYPKHKNGRNFATTNGHSINKLKLHSTNQPLPSRTTPAHHHHCTPLSNNASLQLSSHNNIHNNTPFIVDSSQKQEEKSDDTDTDTDTTGVVVAAPAVTQSMQFDITMPIKVELLNRCRINKYFNIDGYPQDLHVFNGELPDDLYMKIFSWLDFRSVLISLKLVSRSWFYICSQSSSIGHFECVLPSRHHIQWDAFQFISKLEMYCRGNEATDRWSDYNKVLSECCKVNMRDIKQLMIKFHDFSFYSFSKHPLKRLFKLQRNLSKIELNAIIHWKEHDIADCLRLILDSHIIHTLNSFIVHNFIINPTKEELIELKQHTLNDDEDDDDDDINIIMLQSAKVLAQFLMQCTHLNVFRWYYAHSHRAYTCYGIYIAFSSYFKSLSVDNRFGSITDLHLPSFPLLFRKKERMVYDGIVNRLRLNRLYFSGDLRIIDWKTLSIISSDLEYLELNPSRSTNESFTECFRSNNNLKYLSINTVGLATAGYYQNDELTSFVTPYFRTQTLSKLKVIDINVKFLEEKSLFAFLLKCKYAISLESLSINGQSFNGTLKNDDIRKYIGEFVGDQAFEFRLSIVSQFYSSKSQLKVVRLSNNCGINIDKEEWKKKKKLQIKKETNNDIEQSLSMKLADIQNIGRPRFQ